VGDRKGAKIGLLLTILLGMAFTALQVVEYIGSWLLVRRLDLRFGLLHGHRLPRLPRRASARSC
jgi:hypothetical protein